MQPGSCVSCCPIVRRTQLTSTTRMRLFHIRTGYQIPYCLSPLPLQALAEGGSKLWVATTSSSIHGYNLPRDHICPITLQRYQQQQQQQNQQQQDDALQSLEDFGPPMDGSNSSPFQQAASALPALPPAASLPTALSLTASGSGRHIFGSSASVRLRHQHDPRATGDVPLVYPAVDIQGAPGKLQRS